MKKYSQLLKKSILFNNLVKLSFIKKVDNYWVVFSRKWKPLGKYKTREEAEKRLKQIEYFKYLNKKASTEKMEDELSYSYLIREFNKVDKKIAIAFQKLFKKYFDYAYLKNIDEPENFALFYAIKDLAPNKNFKKRANPIDMGNPVFAAKYLANIIKFLLKRIKPESRDKAINNLRKKIYYINEYQISNKKVPPSSAMGQSISLLKTVLLEHEPQYIRKVLNNIVRFI